MGVTATGFAAAALRFVVHAAAPGAPAMVARLYFQILHSIETTARPVDLEAMRGVVRGIAMHPLERQALERVLRRRALSLAVEAEIPRGTVARAD